MFYVVLFKWCYFSLSVCCCFITSFRVTHTIHIHTHMHTIIDSINLNCFMLKFIFKAALIVFTPNRPQLRLQAVPSPR